MSNTQKPVPDFEIDKLKSSDLKGQWHLLTFWAYWCLPCLVELPSLSVLDEHFSDAELKIIAINLDEPTSENFERAKQFASENSLQFSIYYDIQKSAAKAFQINELPQNFLIDPNGKIVWSSKGSKDWSDSKAISELKKIITPKPSL